MRKTFKQLLQQYKETGVLPWKHGKRIDDDLPHYEGGKDAEQTYGTYQLPELTVTGRRRFQFNGDDRQDATRVFDFNQPFRGLPGGLSHMEYVAPRAPQQAFIGPETRSSEEIQRGHQRAAIDREAYHQQLQDEKAQEGFWNLVRLTSPSTYIGQAIGKQLTGTDALAADALAFGGFGAIKNAAKSVFRRVGSAIKRPTNTALRSKSESSLGDINHANIPTNDISDIPTGSDFDLDTHLVTVDTPVPDQVPVFSGFHQIKVDPNEPLLYPGKHIPYEILYPSKTGSESFSLSESADRYLKMVDAEIRGSRSGITTYNWRDWKNLTDAEKLDAVSQVVRHPEYNIQFRVPKPGYDGFLGRDKYGYMDFYGDARDPNIGLFIPESKKDFVLNDEELAQFLGESPKKLDRSVSVNPPSLSKDRVDWSDYKKEVYDRIMEDWNSNGPLSSHLKRSGLIPNDIIGYMMTPEQAWYQSFKNPGLDLSSHIFKLNMQDNAVRLPEFRRGIEFAINKILRSYNIKNPNFKIDTKYNIWNPRIHSKRSVTSKIEKKYDISSEKSEEIFEKAFNYTLKSDTKAAKEFFLELDRSYNNAFASRPNGTMFVPLADKNFARVVSHELGHLEDALDLRSVKSVVNSKQINITPRADSPLFNEAFDFNNLDGSDIAYFTRNGSDATEMAQRFTQLADELRLAPGEEMTPGQLEFMRDNYVNLTGMDNNMKEFFSTFKNIKKAAKWGSAYHKALIPLIIGSSLTLPKIKNHE